MHTGWTPDPAGVEAFLLELEAAGKHPRFAAAAPQLLAAEPRDAFLWEPLVAVHPAWQRGAQGIGDCVSWGWELGCLLLMAAEVVIAREPESFAGEIATEPIYGGSRVEARGGKLGGWSDGSYGAAAARWVRDWGVLLRRDYSAETANPEHDLTRYSAERAKSWGHYGCGGKRDARGAGPLDELARVHPVREVALVKTVEEAAAALMSYKPVVVCSDVGFGSMERSAQGVVRARGTWQHCMLYGGVRWVDGAPQFRQFQSWGRSCSGPDPGVTHAAVSHCSWWTTAEDAARQLKQGDSFALAGLEGWESAPVDHLLI